VYIYVDFSASNESEELRLSCNRACEVSFREVATTLTNEPPVEQDTQAGYRRQRFMCTSQNLSNHTFHTIPFWLG
jgi:hypothetical protein